MDGSLGWNAKVLTQFGTSIVMCGLFESKFCLNMNQIEITD